MYCVQVNDNKMERRKIITDINGTFSEYCGIDVGDREQVKEWLKQWRSGKTHFLVPDEDNVDHYQQQLRYALIIAVDEGDRDNVRFIVENHTDILNTVRARLLRWLSHHHMFDDLRFICSHFQDHRNGINSFYKEMAGKADYEAICFLVNENISPPSKTPLFTRSLDRYYEIIRGEYVACMCGNSCIVKCPRVIENAARIRDFLLENINAFQTQNILACLFKHNETEAVRKIFASERENQLFLSLEILLAAHFSDGVPPLIEEIMCQHPWFKATDWSCGKKTSLTNITQEKLDYVFSKYPEETDVLRNSESLLEIIRQNNTYIAGYLMERYPELINNVEEKYGRTANCFKLLPILIKHKPNMDIYRLNSGRFNEWLETNPKYFSQLEEYFPLFMKNRSQAVQYNDD